MSANLLAIHRSYVNDFPTEVPAKAAQGFIVTAAISLIAGRAANVSFIGGAIAATASVIEALTRPVIRGIFPDNPFIAKSIQICIPKLVALGLAGSLAPWIGLTYKITSVLIPLLAWIALNDRFYERNVGMVEIL